MSGAVDAPPPLFATPQHLGQTLIGKRLEHYELVEFVGGGGMGAVFRANDTRLGRTVAVKVLSRDQTDEETIRRFRNEAQSAARLDHPNIARVHFVGEEGGWNYIVFEFIEGINLRDLVEKNGPLSLDEAFSYTLQVTEALAHASSRDVVHRDIKPSNVIIMPSGAVKLVDMGLARLHQVESSSDDLTASGVTLGTFDYISPEQARDPRSADVRSDIYSLGCTLYFTLVGQPPFPDGTALQKLLRHNGDDPPDVRLFRPELSSKVTTLLNRMLAKRPSQRQQSPEVLIHEILAIADQLDLQLAHRQAPAWVATPEPPSFWSRVSPIVVPVALLIVVLIVLDALMPPRISTADISLRPQFSQPPLKANAATDAKSTTGNTAADLQPRPSANPDRGLRRDGPLAPPSDSGKPSASVAPTVETGAGKATSRTTTPNEGANNSTGTDADTRDEENPASASGTPTSPMTSPSPMTMAIRPAITRLIVQPRAETTLVDGVETVGSLAAACRRAAEAGLTEIELHFDGDLLEKPFEISAPKLTIRPGAGFRPRIVFKPELSASPEQRQMIRLNGGSTGRLSIQGVKLRMDLPVEPSFGWAVFAGNQMQTLELLDCAVTVQDKGSLGGPVHEQVAVFLVLPRRMADTMKMEEDNAMAPPITLALTRTIVRGEATLVSLPDETPLKLIWNQGLLVTSRRLIETGGAALKPKWFGRIEIDLDQVTAVMEQGLHQMRRRGGAAHQLDLDVRSNRSVLFTSPDAALFEFVDVPTVDDVKLTFDGADNCYPRPDMVFVRVKPAAPGEALEEFDLENRGRWSMERRPDLGVTWKDPADDDSPAHEHTKLNYVQVEDAANDAGFDPALLPDLTEPTAELAPPAAIQEQIDEAEEVEASDAPS